MCDNKCEQCQYNTGEKMTVPGRSGPVKKLRCSIGSIGWTEPQTVNTCPNVVQEFRKKRLATVHAQSHGLGPEAVHKVGKKLWLVDPNIKKEKGPVQVKFPKVLAFVSGEGWEKVMAIGGVTALHQDLMQRLEFECQMMECLDAPTFEPRSNNPHFRGEGWLVMSRPDVKHPNEVVA